MMSAQRLAPALAALTYPAISANRAPCSVARRPMRPLFPRAGYRDLTLILLAFLRGGRRSGFARVVVLPNESCSWPAGSLYGPSDS